MSRGWAKASACRLQITLYCAFLCHVVSLQYRSSLHRLAGLPCRIFLSYGLQVVTREVHRSSLRRLIRPAQDHFVCLTVLIISMTFVFSLTQMLVFLYLYVMLSILLSILVCAAASLFCACLVCVQVSAPCISLSWFFFSEAVVLSQVHVSLDIFYQHIVHVYWGVVYNHYLCLCDVHLKTNSPTFIG